MKLRVLSSLLLLLFPACQLAAQANSNVQKFLSAGVLMSGRRRTDRNAPPELVFDSPQKVVYGSVEQRPPAWRFLPQDSPR